MPSHWYRRSGRPVAQLAKELGVDDSTLGFGCTTPMPSSTMFGEGQLEASNGGCGKR